MQKTTRLTDPTGQMWTQHGWGLKAGAAGPARSHDVRFHNQNENESSKSSFYLCRSSLNSWTCEHPDPSHDTVERDGVEKASKNCVFKEENGVPATCHIHKGERCCSTVPANYPPSSHNSASLRGSAKEMKETVITVGVILLWIWFSSVVYSPFLSFESILHTVTTW